jgi:hypothetical protein
MDADLCGPLKFGKATNFMKTHRSSCFDAGKIRFLKAFLSQSEFDPPPSLPRAHRGWSGPLLSLLGFQASSLRVVMVERKRNES